MTLDDRIKVLGQLGTYLSKKEAPLQAAIQATYIHNKWFTPENSNKAIDAIVDQLLDPFKLEDWVKPYTVDDAKPMRRVGIVMTDQVPLQGFSDIVYTFVAGQQSVIKLAEKDQKLIPHIIETLHDLNPATSVYFELAERLKDFDAVIATGTKKTARYFESYFGKYPNIIRRSRHAVAVLDGNESATDLKGLGDDVFQYFGLSCRNVSKLYLPEAYDFDALLTVFHEHKELVMHNKYKNNFDYNYTLVILNKIPYEANGCIILTEERTVESRIASLHYEYYSDSADLLEKLNEHKEVTQKVIGNQELEGISMLRFGEIHRPCLGDYLNGVDVMAFLISEDLQGA